MIMYFVCILFKLIFRWGGSSCVRRWIIFNKSWICWGRYT